MVYAIIRGVVLSCDGDSSAMLNYQHKNTLYTISCDSEGRNNKIIISTTRNLQVGDFVTVVGSLVIRNNKFDIVVYECDVPSAFKRKLNKHMTNFVYGVFDRKRLRYFKDGTVCSITAYDAEEKTDLVFDEYPITAYSASAKKLLSLFKTDDNIKVDGILKETKEQIKNCGKHAYEIMCVRAKI